MKKSTIFKQLAFSVQLLLLLTFGFAAQVQAQIIDNLDPEFTPVGTWGVSSYSPGYYGTDYGYAFAGTGSNTASWTFTIAADGQYAIDAQWAPSNNRASNAPYSIYNNGVLVTTVRVDQLANGGVFNRLVEHPLLAGTVTVTLSDDANGVVIADAVQVSYLGAPQNAAPNGSIDSPAGDLTIAVGDSVNFIGSGTDWDNNTPLTYLWNFGAGSGAADSTLQSPSVQFNTAGTYTVSLTVTDTLGLADPSPATVTITVQAPDTGVVYDNTGAEFSTVGTWGISSYSPGYYGTDYTYAFAGTGSQTASWSLSLATEGQYAIDAQWAPSDNRASNAPYAIYNNGVLVTTVRVDQRANGGVFNRLIDVPLQPGTVTVQLSDDGDGLVVADAIKLTYLGPPQNAAPESSIDAPTGPISIVVGESVNFIGSGTDVDNNTPLSYLWNFGTGSGIPDSALQSPSVQFNTAGTYTVSLTVTDALGQADPTPATVTVTVQSLLDGLAFDNAGGNFSTVGTWGVSSNSPGYYGTDYAYAFAGTGSNTASWTFNLGADGQYAIDAQWAPSDNRASNAPYSIYNNGVLITTVRVDQRVNGGVFNRLLEHPLLAGTVTIVLSDDADGVVVADAVQITYLGAAQNVAPVSYIDSPTADLVIAVGDSVDFVGSGTDWDNNTPFTYFWTFGAGSGVADSSLQSPSVQFNTIGTFTVSLTVTDALGLPDLTPATLTVVVKDPADIWTFDNTEPVFSTVGSWGVSDFSPGFYAINYAYAPAGVGNNTATWTINIAQAGLYHIGAQWAPSDNRATNAPYSIYNNGILIETVTVDQRANGGVFNRLSSYDLDVGTVAIEISDNADGYVVADAVKLDFVTSTPVVMFDTPENNFLSTAPTVYVKAIAANHPDTWGVEFVLNGDDASSVKDYSFPYEHTFSALPKSEHIVTAYLVDGAGVRQTATDQLNFGVGDYYVGFGDSITAGVGDDVTTDNVSLDGRNDWKGYSPILNNLLTAKKAYPHTVIAEGVGSETSPKGLLRLPSVLAAHPDAQYFLIQYGTNDFTAGTSSGLGLNVGDAGYAASYKDNMQQMIDTVIAAGKTPILAKVPSTLSSNPDFNATMQLYNQVVDELVALNGLAPGPDLYAHFSVHPEEFADDLHPNGVGYQSMANLWANKL